MLKRAITCHVNKSGTTPSARGDITFHGREQVSKSLPPDRTTNIIKLKLLKNISAVNLNTLIKYNDYDFSKMKLCI